MQRFDSKIFIVLIAFSLSTSLVRFADAQSTLNWPEYRGPLGDGQAIGETLVSKIDESKHVKWKTPIHGKGWSSPVVWGDQVWLTTATEDGKEMSAICVDVHSGKVVRDMLIHENEKPAFCHPTNSYASPTPAIEEGRVYLHFGSYGTTCLNTKTGEQVWQRKDLECDHFRGPASSPILYDNMLIVALDGFDFQYVVALDKETGKTIWKTDREIDYGSDNGDLKKAYSTGSVFEIDGVPILVYPSAVATIAYNAKTGKPVWTVYHKGMNASARPVMTHNGLIVISNGMGNMIAVDPKGTGDITKTNVAWTLKKGATKKPSQLIIENRMYMVSDKGIASCVDPETGKTLWAERVGGSFSASPIFDGTKILAFSEQGDVVSFLPAGGFESAGKSKLGDGFKASPAVSGKKMILRSFSHLYCVVGE
ncbi:MAG: PQQ-binding-like beta-propeller repeat protein [Mariniblastus sp.]